MPLDHRQLECFVAVAEEGHLGRAAAHLHMTQPPLTRRIQRLESDLGAQLFIRTPHGVEITPPGRVLLAQARQLLALSDRTVQVTRAAAAGEAGELFVGYTGSTIFNAMPQLLASFTELLPDVTLRLERVAKEELVEAVVEGRAHVAFGRIQSQRPEVVMWPIGAEPLFLAAPARFRVRSDPGVADLANLPLVLFPRARPGFADEVIELCEKAGFTPTVAAEAFDALDALAYVATGSAAAVVPRPVTSISLPGVSFYPLRDGPSLELCCVYRGGEQPPLVRAFVDHVATWDGGLA